MAEEDNKTLETVLTPLSPTEAGAPPKISPFSAPPAADPVAQPAPAPAAPAATAPAAPTPAASPAPAPADAAAPAPAAAPAGTTTQRTTIRLKPVIRKPTIRKPMAPAARPPAMPAPAPKKTTSNLKSVTGPVPAQAILKKTGIVAEGILTPAQAQAAKSKTTRISLESAMGVAPAKETPAPLKTIRLRRPTDLKRPGPSPLKPATPAPAADAVSTKAETVIRGAAQAEASAPAAAPSLENQPTLLSISPAAPVSTEATTVVSEQDSGQKKTLKLHRPGISGRRPALGIKKPGAVSEPAAGAGDDVPELPSQTLVDDVPELKPLTAADFGAAPARELSAGVPKWVMTFSLITTIAAAAVIGFVAFLLVQEGCGPDAGENAMAFIQTN